MRKTLRKHSVRSVNLLSVFLLSLFLFGSFGCAQDKPIVFDYASQPEEFVVKLKANQHLPPDLEQNRQGSPYAAGQREGSVSDPY